MIFLLISLGTLSVLQPHLSPKAIDLSIPHIEKSNVIYNYANTIWIQDQVFIN